MSKKDSPCPSAALRRGGKTVNKEANNLLRMKCYREEGTILRLTRHTFLGHNKASSHPNSEFSLCHTRRLHAQPLASRWGPMGWGYKECFSLPGLVWTVLLTFLLSHQVRADDPVEGSEKVKRIEGSHAGLAWWPHGTQEGGGPHSYLWFIHAHTNHIGLCPAGQKHFTLLIYRELAL